MRKVVLFLFIIPKGGPAYEAEMSLVFLCSKFRTQGLYGDDYWPEKTLACPKKRALNTSLAKKLAGTTGAKRSRAYIMENVAYAITLVEQSFPPYNLLVQYNREHKAMPIQVICRGCHSRFKVNEKFAGKKGACPKCKAPIEIPELKDEVVVHAPEAFGGGGRGASGKLTLKPIKREETRFNPILLGIAAVCVISVFIVTWFLGGQYEKPEEIPTMLLALGALVLAPPLVYVGYVFFRDSELQPYRGQSLWIRIAICSVSYAVLWGLYTMVIGFLVPDGPPDVWLYIVVVPGIIALGGLASFASLDLDTTSAPFHYCFYVGMTVLLRVTMGLPPY